MNDRRVMLKVKLKALAHEARSIRHEELRLIRGLRRATIKDPAHAMSLREELYLQRTRRVRASARTTHLAYGFVRGRARWQMEPHARALCASREAQLREQVRLWVLLYGGGGEAQQRRLDAWFDAPVPEEVLAERERARQLQAESRARALADEDGLVRQPSPLDAGGAGL